MLLNISVVFAFINNSACSNQNGKETFYSKTHATDEYLLLHKLDSCEDCLGAMSIEHGRVLFRGILIILRD